MKYVYLFLAMLLFAACGKSSTNDYAGVREIGGACMSTSECDCPEGYDTSCEEGQCLCLKTEIVEADAGPSGCQTDEDCQCGMTAAGPYDPSCQSNGVCFCKEVNRECYVISRGEFVHHLMDKFIDLANYQPPATPSFADVPTSHEFYAAIEAAIEQGFIDANLDDFRPDDNLNRAEMIKIFIVATDGLAGYNAPASPSYMDVEESAWYYDYIEAATANGLTKGYVDENGDSTGYFGPGDVASSCMVDSLLVRIEAMQNDDIRIVVQDISFINWIQIAGQTEQLMVRYRVFGATQTSPLNSLTVVNQPDGEGTPIKPTSAISQVWVSCPNPSGSSYSSSLAGGKAVFNNLNCYQGDDGEFELQVAYDVSSFALVGESLSGQVFRLVLDDNRLLDSQENVPTKTVRKSKPVLSNGTGPSTALINGELGLFDLLVAAHANGSVGLARLSFDVNLNDNDGGGELALSEFKLYRDGVLHSDANFFDAGANDVSGTTNLTGNRIMVTFSQEEVIAAGTVVNYRLKATVVGVEALDQVVTSLSSGDDNTPVTGKTAETTPNTAKIVSSVNNVGLFVSTTFFQASTPGDRSIIWSDRSADAHTYSVQDSQGSYDWTNGYRLDAWLLSPVTLEN